MELLKDFFTSSKMITFYWHTFDSFIVVLIGTLTLIQPDEVNGSLLLVISMSIALLQRVTKEINKKFLS